MSHPELNQSTFQALIESYPSVLNSYISAAKPKSLSKFTELDSSLSTISSAIQERRQKGPNSPYITVEELSKIVEWKLTRGKFRPNLLKFAASNQLDLVKSVSSTAFRILSADKISTTESIPFMSDEALFCVPKTFAKITDSKGKLQYTVPAYLEYWSWIDSVVEDLNKDTSDTHRFTHVQVEQALWTWQIAKSRHIEIGVKSSSAAANEESFDRNASKNSNKRKKNSAKEEVSEGGSGGMAEDSYKKRRK
ncbi:hypothetical protein BKA69DRAFT_604427 [Paraphysoderma sedebokerense]|nr:hypothetical protein BKA69DRAFT_604427 [Paraphysoderma sedebokerense]